MTAFGVLGRGFAVVVCLCINMHHAMVDLQVTVVDSFDIHITSWSGGIGWPDGDFHVRSGVVQEQGYT